ncbi:MAG TPA: MmcQ/YjbR family DNA-binding protein [Ignavibacteriales bacterium]|nr:MmcQ/YjbR family DNA-binding protein [Ignavibacteriales bacterium]
MDIESFRQYCLKKKGAAEDYPFNEETLVFKVMNKIFALTPLEKIPLSINIKCDPERALELREMYESVLPGYHMSKKNWITVVMDNSMPDKLFKELVDNSYDLVVQGLKKSERIALEALKD